MGTAAAAIMVADRRGTITSWNDGAEALLGHRAADAVGRSLGLIVPEAYRDAHWKGFRRAMAIYAEPAGGEQVWGEILPLDGS